MSTETNWKIAGSAGLGVKSTGVVMAKALSRVGLFINGYTEYPSLIRGGHNTYQVFASGTQVGAPHRELTVMVALNQAAVDNHKKEFGSKTFLVADKTLDVSGVKAKVVSLPILEKAKELGNVIVQNVICLGVSAALMGVEPKVFEELIEEQFGKKKELLSMNKQAFAAGYEMVGDDRQEVKHSKVEVAKMTINGSEAVGLGAIAAGVQFYGAYPMTPSTPVLHYLIKHQEDYGYVVRQTEDEISAINMCIGASFSGAKAMTGTSGGGFALMQEGVSLAGMLELPLVVMLAMRPGPATGLPTWTGQGELRFAIHSGHGEFAKIVLAPGDPEEAYELAYKAFEMAQEYQTIVILLTDKLLVESHYSVEKLEKKVPVKLTNITYEAKQPQGEMFHRYQPTPNGVADRTLPGVPNGFYIANSDEHGPDGLVDETAEMREVMVNRRMQKMKSIAGAMSPPVLYGNKKAKNTFVGFGSVKGSVLEAMKQIDDINYLHFTHVWPLPGSTAGMLADKNLVFIENNMTGQLEGLLREHFGVTGKNFRKDDGRPFYPEEIVNFVKKEL